MKKISIIDYDDLNVSSKEFNQICLNLSKKYKDNYVFQNYMESKAKIDFYFNGFSILLFKNNKLSKFVKSVYILLHCAFNADILIVNGINASLYFPILNLFFRKKIILLISDLDVINSQNTMLSKKFYEFKKYVAFNFSHRIITSQLSIQDLLKAKFNLKVDLIELGGDHINHIESSSLDHRHYPFLKYMYAVSYFIDDTNNHIEIVLDTFKRCKNIYIVIIGDWNKTNRGIYLKNKYAGYSNIYMIYPCTFERETDLIISNSILYIHSSSLANYSLPLIEAMSLKLPVNAIESIDNLYITEGRASYFKNVSELNYFIDNLSIEKLRKNAIAMKEVSSLRFNWNFLIEKYGIIIQELSTSIFKKTIYASIEKKYIISSQSSRTKLKPRFTFFNVFFNLFM